MGQLCGFSFILSGNTALIPPTPPPPTCVPVDHVLELSKNFRTDGPYTEGQTAAGEVRKTKGAPHTRIAKIQNSGQLLK